MDTKLKEGNLQYKYNSEPFTRDWDRVPSCSTLKLFHANTRLQEAQRDLIVKNIEVQRERLYNVCDWREVQDNKAELRRLFIETNKTICDNKASMHRFKHKIKEFVRAQILVLEEIDCTKSEIEKYSLIKEKMEKYVTLYSGLFTSYLEMVAQKCPDFNSVQDILNQYEVLEKCKLECAQLLDKEMNKALELKNEMMKIVEEKSNQLKNLNNALILIQVRRKQIADVRKNWNHVVRNLEQVIARRLEESVAIGDGCYDLYREICNKRKLKPVLKKGDTKNQMHQIEKTILFYKDVIHLASALQQFQNQGKQTENNVSKSKFVKRVLNDLIKQ